MFWLILLYDIGFKSELLNCKNKREICILEMSTASRLGKCSLNPSGCFCINSDKASFLCLANGADLKVVLWVPMQTG